MVLVIQPMLFHLYVTEILKMLLCYWLKNTNSTNKLHFIICVYYYFKNSWSLVQQY